MSSLLSSCTLLSLAPPALGKLSPAALPLRIKQPSAAASSPSAVALPRAAPYKVSSRAPRLVCHAHTYNILPNALLHPPVGDQNNWRIYEGKNHIFLMFDIGKETEEGNLKVTTTKDQALNVWLHIRYMGDGRDKSQATLLDARLQMPPGCDGKSVTKAEISDGTLQINIAKPKPESKDISVTKGKPPVVADEKEKQTSPP